jgi:hypothetical protein
VLLTHTTFSSQPLLGLLCGCAVVTDPHLPAPRRRLQVHGRRIQTLLTEMAREGRGILHRHLGPGQCHLLGLILPWLRAEDEKFEFLLRELETAEANLPSAG